MLEDCVYRLDKQMNGNGKPGLVGKLEEFTDELRRNRSLDTAHVELLHAQNGLRMDKMEKLQSKVTWTALGIYVAWQFLTGAGTTTLKTIMDSVHH